MDKIRQWENERDAARKAASAQYDTDLEAADAAHKAALEKLALADVRSWLNVPRNFDHDAHRKKSAAAAKEIEDQYKALRKAAYEKHLAACEAAEQRFDRLYDALEAKESRRARKAAAKVARQKARERENDIREARAARVALAAQVAIALNPPVVTISPARAASIVGLTMGQFWARVRSGRYPAPNDDNLYDADTIARLPRPKVRVQRATPDNILTRIMRF